jgi:NAD kinase
LPDVGYCGPQILENKKLITRRRIAEVRIMMRAVLYFKESKYTKFRKRKDEPQFDRYLNSNSKRLQEDIRHHDLQQESFTSILSTLDSLHVDYQVVGLDEYTFNPSEISRKTHDIVIISGGDGTAISASKFVDDVPLLGVNPGDSVGFYCTATSKTLKDTLVSIERVPITRLNRLSSTIDDKVLGLEGRGVVHPIYAINEVQVQHKDCRTNIEFTVEAQDFLKDYKINGFNMATPSGSTAMMRNLYGEIVDLGSDAIQYIAYNLRDEKPRFSDVIRVTSHHPSAAVYIDNYFRSFDLEMESTLTVQQGKPLYVVGDMIRKQRERYR